MGLQPVAFFKSMQRITERSRRPYHDAASSGSGSNVSLHAGLDALWELHGLQMAGP